MVSPPRRIMPGHGAPGPAGHPAAPTHGLDRVADVAVHHMDNTKALCLIVITALQALLALLMANVTLHHTMRDHSVLQSMTCLHHHHHQQQNMTALLRQKDTSTRSVDLQDHHHHQATKARQVHLTHTVAIAMMDPGHTDTAVAVVAALGVGAEASALEDGADTQLSPEERRSTSVL